MPSYFEICVQAKPRVLARVDEWPQVFEIPYDEDDEPIIFISDTARDTIGRFAPQPLSLEDIIVSFVEEPNLMLVDFAETKSDMALQDIITNAILEAAARRVINEIAEQKGIEDRIYGIEHAEPTAQGFKR